MKNYRVLNACGNCKYAVHDYSARGCKHVDPITKLERDDTEWMQISAPRSYERPGVMLCLRDGVPVPDVDRTPWIGNEVPQSVIDAGNARKKWHEDRMVERFGVCDAWESK